MRFLCKDLTLVDWNFQSFAAVFWVEMRYAQINCDCFVSAPYGLTSVQHQKPRSLIQLI
jgi:hypothetical protein